MPYHSITLFYLLTWRLVVVDGYWITGIYTVYEYIPAYHDWPFMGESTGPSQRTNNAETVFMSWRKHSDTTGNQHWILVLYRQPSGIVECKPAVMGHIWCKQGGMQAYNSYMCCCLISKTDWLYDLHKHANTILITNEFIKFVHHQWPHGLFYKRYTLNQYLTHRGRDKMAAISQTTLSSAFSWMEMFEFRLKFQWSLFIRVESTIFQHWFRYWLGAVQATSQYLNQWWLI